MTRFEIHVHNVKSSNIRSIFFSASYEDGVRITDLGELEIVFRNGSRYVYHDVPMSSVIDLTTSESVGRRFNSLNIATKYKYQKLT